MTSSPLMGSPGSISSISTYQLNRTWEAPDKQTRLTWVVQPPTPASMLWKIFCTHTCGTPTPLKLTLSGFLNILQQAGVVSADGSEGAGICADDAVSSKISIRVKGVAFVLV